MTDGEYVITDVCCWNCRKLLIAQFEGRAFSVMCHRCGAAVTEKNCTTKKMRLTYESKSA